MRADIRRMLVKGKNKQLVDKIIAYVALRPATERVIITMSQHEALARCASGASIGAGAGNVVLCCGDVIVHYNHEQIDESYHAPTPGLIRDKFSADLPPVSANPFGVVVPVKAAPAPIAGSYNYGDFADDDIPF